MLVELDVKKTTVNDLKSGDWFVITNPESATNQRKSIWMLVNPDPTLFNKQSNLKHIVKVAHIHIPNMEDSKDSIIPIGSLVTVGIGTSVIPLDHDNEVLKLKEKKLC